MSERAGLALPIVLIGAMGAGKSAVGQRLAASVGAPFIDTDARIVERYGPIEEIFARRGEEAFRVVEREVVAEALREEAVISLGGGAVLHPETRRDLADLPVVWLRVSPEAVAPRLTGGTRPLLAEGGLARWAAILEERTPVYRSLADLDIDTSRRSVPRIVHDIAERFGGSR
ncbi:shikimate kinase [Agromyces bauzanensis]|uniref:Shikimate kinase n=1 Tax=Agromyces bauzanensis TaxID=1308924 RepID=A0A917PFA7_9MICO|nr:shikimate kinase [Agromyces bauzanensis]GGJ74240.1 shikimate kinase [Agromyces bauzanensis]